MSPTYIPSTPISTSLSGGSVASDRTTLPKPTHPSDNSSDNSEETSLAAEAIASSPDEQNSREAWSIEQSEELYRIKGWGEPYFSINAAGNITVSPQGDRGGSLDLYQLVEGLKQRDFQLPILIRFSEILEDRLERLNACFAKAIARYSYEGVYQGVFPVKCNQQRHIVEDLARFGKPYQFGLEAGTKPELMIAMASLDTPGSLIICNGYKDDAYLETAMLGQRLGQKIIIVLEQVEEVDVAIALSQRLGIQPVLGVRAKLAAKGSGRWGESAGDRAKFGLSIPEIITVVEKLEAANMLPCLQLLHFHIGSQVSAISVIKDALREACQIYVELVKLGAPMGYLDVGGGLGVDYDGSKTSSQGSKNYSIQNYANDVVAEVKDACSAQAIPMPTLVSESGRAIASHQSVLIFDILGTSEATSYETPKPYVEGEHRLIRELWDLYTSLSPENYQEAFNDAVQFKKEAAGLFNFSYLRLTERARVERLYWACCAKIVALLRNEDYIPEELEHLEKSLASIYYANMSLFQSALDSWAIEQLFPLLPIHRLTEEPTQRATLADLTCDSDGKIARFIGPKGTKDVLELHPLKANEPYYLGMFLVGAYQETLGNLHNLFGNTNTVHICLASKARSHQGYTIEHVVRGNTTDEVLAQVQYDPEQMIEQIRLRSELALQNGQITIEEARKLMANYKAGMTCYTYLAES
ncbi:MAG: arginine decarboxylase SpeA [Phormidesmis priestleyi Ana]|uniref:Biosynthetic arginine decarboxylase n=1 Tax=Phormidesmis priestleyi Ana TaxID=1666911 RepID=A0A0P8DFE3_9CYAN|nr:MAG: arginine decarboxylase SpeA [Phormidesmis priestleyi Ana]